MEAQGIDFRSIFYNICIQYYKFPSKPYFHWIPQNLGIFLFIFTYFKVFLISCEMYSLPMCYLEVCCIISKYSGIFQISFHYWFNFILVWEWTMNDLYSFIFIMVCFMAQNVNYLGECSILTWEECIFCFIGWSNWLCHLYPIDGWCSCIELCPYWFFASWISPFLTDECWSLWF